VDVGRWKIMRGKCRSKPKIAFLQLHPQNRGKMFLYSSKLREDAQNRGTIFLYPTKKQQFKRGKTEIEELFSSI
jgi:hypothetical protein